MKNNNPLKLLISFLVLIGLLFGAFIFIENRYLTAENLQQHTADAALKFQKINTSLDRIYVHQLKTEARGILKDLQWRNPTNTEKVRLENIADTLQKLGSNWKPVLPKRID